MKNFLVCHRGGLGDFVFIWPALCCLKKAYPQYHFTGIGHISYMRLAVLLGLLESCHDMEFSGMRDFFVAKSIPSLIGQPDGAVLWLSDAKEIEALLKKGAPLPVVTIAPFPQIQTHIARYYCLAVKQYFPIDIPEEFCFDFLYGEKKSDYALIHPGSGSMTKNYPPGFYLSIADRLRKSGYDKISFILGPAELESGVEKDFPSEKICKPDDVSGLASLISGASLFIGNDSGVSHLAGILGIPTITLFKTTDPKIWGSIGKCVFNIKAENEGDVLMAIESILAKTGH